MSDQDEAVVPRRPQRLPAGLRVNVVQQAALDRDARVAARAARINHPVQFPPRAESPPILQRDFGPYRDALVARAARLAARRDEALPRAETPEQLVEFPDPRSPLIIHQLDFGRYRRIIHQSDNEDMSENEQRQRHGGAKNPSPPLNNINAL